MTDDRSIESLPAAISHAMHEEGHHFFEAVRLDGSASIDSPQALLRQCAAAMLGAGAAAANRLVRENPSDADWLRSYIAVANDLERSLPHELQAMWMSHFVYGASISEYAASTGRDIVAARAEYRNIVRALVPKPREAGTVGEHDAGPRGENRHAATP